MQQETLLTIARYIDIVAYAVSLGLFALLVAVVMRRPRFAWVHRISFRVWCGIALAWSAGYAAYLTIAQYIVWSSSEITQELTRVSLSGDVPRIFLHAPVAPFLDGAHGYYIFYAYTHFWMPVLLAVASAALMGGFFAYVRKRRAGVVGDEELQLGTGISFLAGWPQVLIFAVLAFIGAAIHTLVQHVRVGKEARTRMVLAMIVAGAVTLMLGTYIGSRFGIGAMVV